MIVLPRDTLLLIKIVLTITNTVSMFSYLRVGPGLFILELNSTANLNSVVWRNRIRGAVAMTRSELSKV